jgi:hypothetical protein
MSEDVHENWSLVTGLGIQLDDAGEVWNSGCVRDLLPLDEHSVLVATDTGGIWYADDTGNGYSLQDFPEPDMLCLESAHTGWDQNGLPIRVYFAGTPSGVWATSGVTGVPSAVWMSTGGDVGQVNRIQFDWNIGRVIIATSKGIYWSDLPDSNWPWGASNFSWQQAVLPIGDAITGNFVDLALTQRPPNQVRGVVATRRAVGWDWAWPYGKFFFGGWNPLPNSPIGSGSPTAALVMDSLNPAQPSVTQIGVVSVAVGAGNTSQVYAAASNAGGDFDYLYRSKDGGQSWERSKPKFLDQAGNKLDDAYLPHGQGNNDRFNNCLSVARDPTTLALGWRYAGAYVSRDGGDSFIRAPEARGAHADVHAIRFDPYDKSGERLYLGSDGGVIRMGAFARDTGTVNTLFNKALATIQFASRPGRQFDGDFGASIKNSIVAGGTQDTAVLYNQWGAAGPWRPLGSDASNGDGHDVVGVGDGLVYIDIYHGDSDPSPPILAWWDHSSGTMKNLRETIDAAHLHPFYKDLKWALSNARLVRIKSPALPDWNFGYVYRAIAFDKQDIFGLMWEPGTFGPAWNMIFGLTNVIRDQSVSPSNQPPISSVGTADGRVIYVGSVGGTILSYSADRPLTDRLRNLNVPATLIEPSSKTPTSRILHIAVASSNLAFASLEMKNGQHVLLRLRDETKTDVLYTGRSDTIYGVETWRTRIGRLAVFVSYDDAILVSIDEGGTWSDASNGLPSKPHCCSLHIFRDAASKDIMYLTTYGRSMWKTILS